MGDRALQAQALAGLAEIRVARGEPESAIRDAKRALAAHRELNDAVLETEDLRILAVALGVAGKATEAEAMLRQVIDRATEHQRPLLVASAQRDLFSAYLARFVHPETSLLDAGQAQEAWPGWEPTRAAGV